MAKKPRQSKSLTSAERKARDKAARSDLAKLKAKGLYNGDLRKQKPTRYGRNLVRRFADVLTGKAAVVTTSTKAGLEYRKHGFRGKGNRIVVEKAPTDRIVFNKRTGAIDRYSSRYGDRHKETLLAGEPRALKAARGKQIFYTMPFGREPNQYRIRFDSFDELQKFMQPYEQKATNPFLDWQNYVIAEELDDDTETGPVREE